MNALLAPLTEHFTFKSFVKYTRFYRYVTTWTPTSNQPTNQPMVCFYNLTAVSLNSPHERLEKNPKT